MGIGWEAAGSAPSNQAPLPNWGEGDLPGPLGRLPHAPQRPFRAGHAEAVSSGCVEQSGPVSSHPTPNSLLPATSPQLQGRAGAGRVECGCSLTNCTVMKTRAQREDCHA